MKLCTWSFLGWWSQFTTYHIVHSCAFASKALYICIFLASVACAYIVIYNWMHGPLYISTLNEMKRNPLAFSRKNNWMHGWFDYATIYIFFLPYSYMPAYCHPLPGCLICVFSFIWFIRIFAYNFIDSSVFPLLLTVMCSRHATVFPLLQISTAKLIFSLIPMYYFK